MKETHDRDLTSPFSTLALLGLVATCRGATHNAQWRKVEQTSVTFQLDLLGAWWGAHIKHQALHIRAVLVFRVYVTQWI